MESNRQILRYNIENLPFGVIVSTGCRLHPCLEPAAQTREQFSNKMINLRYLKLENGQLIKTNHVHSNPTVDNTKELWEEQAFLFSLRNDFFFKFKVISEPRCRKLSLFQRFKSSSIMLPQQIQWVFRFRDSRQYTF